MHNRWKLPAMGKSFVIYRKSEHVNFFLCFSYVGIIYALYITEQAKSKGANNMNTAIIIIIAGRFLIPVVKLINNKMSDRTWLDKHQKKEKEGK